MFLLPKKTAVPSCITTSLGRCKLAPRFQRNMQLGLTCFCPEIFFEGDVFFKNYSPDSVWALLHAACVFKFFWAPEIFLWGVDKLHAKLQS